MTNLGKTIRILRQAKGWKSNKLAEKAGVSVAYLSLVESGERQPSLAILRQIATELGLPSEALILMSVEAQPKNRKAASKITRLKNSIDRLMEIEDQLKQMLGSEETTDGIQRNQAG